MPKKNFFCARIFIFLESGALNLLIYKDKKMFSRGNKIIIILIQSFQTVIIFISKIHKNKKGKKVIMM